MSGTSGTSGSSGINGSNGSSGSSGTSGTAVTYKVGSVDISEFVGGLPSTASVTFSVPMVSSSYYPLISLEIIGPGSNPIGSPFYITNKETTGFRIQVDEDVTGLADIKINWFAIR